MVFCGSPELPGDQGDNLQTSGIHIPNYGQNTSDDSDDEGIRTAYNGYEPLPLGDTAEDSVTDQNYDAEEDVTETHPDIPPILSSDEEIARQIWDEPRPLVLDMEMDSSRTEQIMSAMANITLPISAIPDWAQEVPEERWKQDLLERIRQRKDTPASTSQTGEGTSK